MEDSSIKVLELFLKDLVLTPWNDPNCILQFNPQCTYKDVSGSVLFQNTRIFLNAIAACDGVKTTPLGNLSREFVKQMFQKLALPENTRMVFEKHYKVINEMDLWELHILRILCHFAKLIRVRGGKVYLTPKGKKLLREEHAGQLYHELFMTHFRKVDLCYIAPSHKVPEIQGTMAVILWRLQMEAADWMPVEGCAPKLLLPKVYDNLHTDRPESVICSYVLNPLVSLGLIETKSSIDSPACVEPDDSVRHSPLWTKFIRFPDPALN